MFLIVRLLFILIAVSWLKSSVARIFYPPVDRHDQIKATLEKEGAQKVWIWNKQNGGAYDDGNDRYEFSTWLCKFSTDSRFGACGTSPVASCATGKTSIKLQFTEIKTKAVAELIVFAIRYSWEISPNGADVMRSGFFLDSQCKLTNVDAGGVGISAYISEDQLKNLPSGGIWEGNLKLDQRPAYTDGIVSEYSAKIVLDVIDKNNIQIYFPEFTSTTPQVDLKLKPQWGSGRVNGVSNIDMCLYDGYNSQSTWFDVTASDGLAIAGRNQGSYSVLREGNQGREFAKRVDYNVSLAYNGTKVSLPNNQKVRLTGVNNSSGRSVSLPGIPVPVICTPTPLTLETPEFHIVDKQQGKYSGKLRITFSPSAENL